MQCVGYGDDIDIDNDIAIAIALSSSCPGNGQQVLPPVCPLLLSANCCGASVVVARSIRWVGLGLFTDACQNHGSPKTTQSVSMLASMVALYRKQIRRSAAVSQRESSCAYAEFTIFLVSPNGIARLLLSSPSALLFVSFIVLLLWGCRNKVI